MVNIHRKSLLNYNIIFLDMDGNTNTTSTPKFSSKSEDKEITSSTAPIPQNIMYAEEDIKHDIVNRGADGLSKSIKHKHLKLDTHINISYSRFHQF